eukprot:24435-Pelagococcus_subviridis.AAC.1
MGSSLTAAAAAAVVAAARRFVVERRTKRAGHDERVLLAEGDRDRAFDAVRRAARRARSGRETRHPANAEPAAVETSPAETFPRGRRERAPRGKRAAAAAAAAFVVVVVVHKRSTFIRYILYFCWWFFPRVHVARVRDRGEPMLRRGDRRRDVVADADAPDAFGGRSRVARAPSHHGAVARQREVMLAPGGDGLDANRR